MPLLHALAIAALCALVGFGAGCVKGKRAGEAERAALTVDAGNARASVEACATTVSAMQQHAQGEIARAAKHAEATNQALLDVVRENLAISDQIGALERQMAGARQEPTCRDQLEVELCPSVPLL